MECGKFPATLKPVFIYRTTFLFKKRAGHPVHDHQAITSLFQVGFIKCIPALLQVSRKVICFLIGNQYHEAFAAVPALGTINLGRNRLIQLADQLVNLCIIPFLYKIPEPLILLHCRCRVGSNFFQIGFDMVVGRGYRAKLYPFPGKLDEIYLLFNLSTFLSHL